MTNKTQPGITKADISSFRVLIDLHRQAHSVRQKVCRKLKCDLFDLDEWADRLGKRPTVTDEDICFAMGRLTYDE